MKRCTKCNRTLQLTDFHKNTSKSDGLQNWCKSCIKETYHQTYKPVDPAAYREMKVSNGLITITDKMYSVMARRNFWNTVLNELRLTTKHTSASVSRQLELIDGELHDLVNEVTWIDYQGIPSEYNDSQSKVHKGEGVELDE